jgi:hypothetical protein
LDPDNRSSLELNTDPYLLYAGQLLDPDPHKFNADPKDNPTENFKNYLRSINWENSTIIENFLPIC